MVAFDIKRRVVAEFLGTALLLATVVGSGIMAERLAAGNVALALLGNTLATGAMLVVLIWVFGHLSGAHFNPVVSFTFALRGELRWRDALTYLPAQIIGAVIGVYMAHYMFAAPLLEVSTKLRDGSALAFSELVATFGLIGTILGTQRFKAETTPVAVGLYVTAAYWFTASTSFANPAVTIARSMTESFSGIAPSSVPLFIGAQFVGAGLGLVVFGWLLGPKQPPAH